MRFINKLKPNRKHLFACICFLLLLVGITSADVCKLVLRAENSETLAVTDTPSQSKYAGDSRLYNGIATDREVQITTGSSYSVEYRTDYQPSNFAEGTFEWQITTREFKYYYDSSTGEYGTQDADGYWINSSTGFAQESVNNSVTEISNSYLPSGTKITLIDMTDETAPTYYYYICTQKTTTIDLDEFTKMGTNTKLLDAEPAFKQEYNAKKSEGGPVSERLVLICDFANSQWDSTENFSGELHLQHLYNDVDVMDYMCEGTDSNYLRSIPKSSKYVMNFSATGMAAGDAAFSASAGNDGKIPNFGSATMSVQWQEATDYINTKLSEGKYAVKVELLDGSGNEKKFPEGMYFECGDVLMRPDGDNMFAVIEVDEHAVMVGESMSAEFRVFNPYYDLRKYMGSDTLKFRLSLYNSADNSYVKIGSRILSTEVTFTIEEIPTYTLNVECVGSEINRILNHGTVLSPIITATSNVDTTSKVQVRLAKKMSGTYTDISFDSVFTTNVEEITAGSYNWEITPSAEAGIYRIIFTYGNRVEYLSFIVN